MKFNRKTDYSYDGREIVISNFETPNQCPRCKRNIVPEFVSLTRIAKYETTITYFCAGCFGCFLADYPIYESLNDGRYYAEEYSNVYPIEFVKKVFDVKIDKLSNSFSKIYNQALEAEVVGLDEIAGMGYRKSLEILIKDYAVFLKPSDQDKILNSKFSLSSCINEYINAPNLKDLSKITSWLGNDEAHYTRIHTDKDINDLKTYLDAAIYFILHDLISKDAADIVNPTRLK